MDRDERCGTCRFFLGGECHRYPQVLSPRGDRDSNIYDQWAFPTISDTEWCGEWQEEFSETDIQAKSVEELLQEREDFHNAVKSASELCVEDFRRRAIEKLTQLTKLHSLTKSWQWFNAATATLKSLPVVEARKD